MKERITDILLDKTDSELVTIYNEYCYKNLYYDDVFTPMCEFDSLCSHMKPSEVLAHVKGCDFDIDDDFFMDTIWGPVSYSLAECGDEIRDNRISEMVDYIIKSNECLNDGDIEEVLDGEEEE